MQTVTPPRVSVLMPVFNTGRYLEQALASIAAQSLRDFELVVIDDGSTDGSAEILSRFAAREPRLRLISRRNRGLIATRNELLAEARADLIAWMDSDDVSLPGRLAMQVAAFDADPELVCLGTAAQCIDPDGNELNVERYPPTHAAIRAEQQTVGAGLRFPTTMIRRELAMRVGGFREPFRLGEDFDFLLRVAEQGKMGNLVEIAYLYRQHVASVCASLGHHWMAYRDRILELAGERAALGRDRLQTGGSVDVPRAAGEGARHEWRVYLAWAGHALRNDDLRLARRYARAALARKPSSAGAWHMMLRILKRGLAGGGRDTAGTAA